MKKKEAEDKLRTQDKVALAEGIMKIKNSDLKERAYELEKRGKARADAVVAVKEAWRKDVDTSKEMKQLKKLD